MLVSTALPKRRRRLAAEQPSTLSVAAPHSLRREPPKAPASDPRAIERPAPMMEFAVLAHLPSALYNATRSPPADVAPVDGATRWGRSIASRSALTVPLLASGRTSISCILVPSN
jgi:hypothetical protein